MIRPAQLLFVNMQTPDGFFFSGQTRAATISQSCAYDGFSGWDVELSGIGEMSLSTVVQDWQNMLTNREYRCEWCGSSNPLWRPHCSQRGGARLFLLDVIDGLTK